MKLNIKRFLLVGISFMFFCPLYSEEPAKRAERLCNNIKKTELGDCLIPFKRGEDCSLIVCPYADKIGSTLQYLGIEYDPDELTKFFEEEGGDIIEMFGKYINKEKNVKAFYIKKFDKSRVQRCLKKGIPILAILGKYSAAEEKAIKTRSENRENIKSVEELMLNVAKNRINTKKTKFDLCHHPEFIVGYNEKTGEYAIAFGYNKIVWYAEKEISTAIQVILCIDISDK